MSEEEFPLEKPTGRVKDPNPERYRYLADLLHRFVSNKIGLADLARLPRKKLQGLMDVGYTKFQHGRLKEALEIYDSLARIDHKNFYYRSVLGGIYQKMKKWVEAVANYTMALVLNPKDVASYVNRGEIFLRHDKYKKAAEDFRSAILLDQVGKNLWANRARSLVIALKRNLEAKKGAEKKRVAAPPRRVAPKAAARAVARRATRKRTSP